MKTGKNTIVFTKMHGLGNDFVVIDATKKVINSITLNVSRLADRHLGIGFDQLLLVESSTSADFLCRIFNSDGSEAEQCGNGLRCVARFIHDKKLALENEFSIETKAGIFNATILHDDFIKISMGVPDFNPQTIPFISHEAEKLNGISIFAVSMGNPHAILIVPTINTELTLSMGSIIAIHPAFPQGANVGFVEIINKDHIRLSTYERGVGPTLACGSNACAAVVAGITKGLLSQKVRVSLTHGDLYIEWLGNNNVVTLIGPTETVFEGNFQEQAI